MEGLTTGRLPPAGKARPEAHWLAIRVPRDAWMNTPNQARRRGPSTRPLASQAEQLLVVAGAKRLVRTEGQGPVDALSRATSTRAVAR